MDKRTGTIDKDRPIVSVIMPAYNAESTLRASAVSVLASACRDIELIIVNDGSTDGTAKVCAELAAEDERVWTITVKNSGPAAARNLGLNTARGQFVTFVDSDDLITPDMFTAMLRGLAVHGADVSVCGASIEYPGGERANSLVKLGRSGLIEGEKLLELFDLPRMTLFFSGWGKLFRRDIIEDNALRLDTKYRITEDTDFVLRCLENCRSVYLVDECCYRYMQVNPGSLTSVRNAEALRDAAFNISGRIKSLMLKWGADEQRAESEAQAYLYEQLNSAVFIKLRSGAKRAEKRAFYNEVMSTPGFKSRPDDGKFSSRVLKAGFAPAMLYVKAHSAYLKLKGKEA